jgi:predicted NUDIX family phosphoesterase
LGIGGHVNLVDSDSSNNPELLIKGFLVPQIYTNAFYRELNEEVEILSPFQNTIIGCVRDTSNDVGRVHFGIIHRLTLKEKKVKTVDPALTNGVFRGIVEIKGAIDKFESWSKLVIRYGL